MDILFVLVGIAVGFLGGLISLDWHQRRQSLKEFRENAAKIAEVHNALAKQVQTIQDSVNAHEFRLGAGRPTGGGVFGTNRSGA